MEVVVAGLMMNAVYERQWWVLIQFIIWQESRGEVSKLTLWLLMSKELGMSSRRQPMPKWTGFFFLSHLGADRASAYPILKVKAIAEEYIRRSGLDFTILRTALVFGPDDGFTSGLAQLLQGLPFIFIVPGDGSSLIQPLWVEDLATCLTWALDDEDTRNRTLEVGGPEYIQLIDVISILSKEIGVKRTIVPFPPPILRGMTVLLEYVLPASPVSVYWLDYLSTNRTCSLDTIPRIFNLMPSRFSHRLDYLKNKNWRRELIRTSFRRRK